MFPRDSLDDTPPWKPSDQALSDQIDYAEIRLQEAVASGDPEAVARIELDALVAQIPDNAA